MAILTSLEKPLEDINKQLPKFPKSLKDFLVQVAPWLTLIGAIASAWGVYNIWHWARAVSYLNDLAVAFGATSATRWSVGLYLSLGVLALSAVIYLLAFAPLREYKKKGWDLLFLAIIVNLIYSAVSAFSSYGTFGSFLGYLIGTALSLYILFQIRDYYIGKDKVSSTNKIGNSDSSESKDSESKSDSDK